ncbi:TPA: hypothetical protein RZ058_002702 [Enterobacter cloacae]|nr:hypothetical protein [Enterobacter cloacae]
MSTITRERAQEIFLGNGPEPTASEERELARIALASLEAEPVAWRWNYGGSTNWRLQECDPGTGDNDKCPRVAEPLYTAPPAPVSVPAAMEMDDDFDSAFEHGKAVGWNACRAAMLQGAEPVATDYKLPSMGSNEINEASWVLHNQLTKFGPLNGYQFNNLKVCFYEALKVAMGNSPLIPDGWVMVPVEPTVEMLSAAKEWTGLTSTAEVVYREMLAAAPQQE